MTASSRAQVLELYRAMLRESKRFSAYNCRTYAVRRIRDAFRENKNVKDPVEIQTLLNKAKRDLGIIRRQVHTGQLVRMKSWSSFRIMPCVTASPLHPTPIL
uniref:Complex 1 LYR protein domain-containing protein n=1 Tax=Cebus imitator TaxID=2715852 RepID=A0A2K5RVH4_CEBIM